MPDPFAALIPETRAFLADLSINNTRDWFKAHKPRYETALKTPATLLLDQFAHDTARRAGIVLRPKLFRPQRDVRFSRDKTPYHLHLHLLWEIAQPGSQSLGFFFGISPDYVRIGGGAMAFDKPTLIRWRAAVDGPIGDAIKGDLSHLANLGLSPDQCELKRVPAPFPRDHRHADLLRRKSLTLWRDLPKSAHKTPLKALSACFDTLHPLLKRLQEIA